MVVNRWLNNTPYPDQGNNPLDWVYLEDVKELHIIDIAIPVDDGLVFGEPQQLIEIVWQDPTPPTPPTISDEL